MGCRGIFHCRLSGTRCGLVLLTPDSDTNTQCLNQSSPFEGLAARDGSYGHISGVMIIKRSDCSFENKNPGPSRR